MHNINFFSFSSRKSTKTIGKECERYAKYARASSWGEGGEATHGLYSPVRFIDKVFDSHDDAYDYIIRNDRGWYDSFAVKYKEGRAIKWLVKIEYHT